MQKLKPVQIVIAVILVLLSLALLQWTKLPKGAQPAPVASDGTSQPAELPVLPQNERYNLDAIPPSLEQTSLLEENSVENNDAPKDPAMNRKAEL